eukprot:13847273-Alexandrium_andersonii.AAC.1
MSRAEVGRRRREVQTRLDFAVRLYGSQLDRGARFPRGHPASASSRGAESTQQLLGGQASPAELGTCVGLEGGPSHQMAMATHSWR